MANGTKSKPVYFHNAADPATRRSACITSQVDVIVQKIENDFGYIAFTNSRGQKSYGWLELRCLVKKEIKQMAKPALDNYGLVVQPGLPILTSLNSTQQ